MRGPYEPTSALPATQSMTPLVRTPRPQPGEPLRPFLTRVAEANGYPSAHWILREAGVADGSRGAADVPVDTLAQLLRVPPERLQHMGYDSGEARPARGNSAIAILGEQVRAYYLQIQAMPVCPGCLRERGYIDAFWHMRYAVACPQHGCIPFMRCPACSARLRWDRPGLGICRCGADLTAFVPEQKAPEDLLGLMQVIRLKAAGESLQVRSLEELGYPVDDLEQLSLNEFCILIQRIGYQGQRLLESGVERPRGWEKTWLEAVGANRMLRDWPNGLRELARLYKQQGEAQSASGVVAGDAWHKKMKHEMFSSGRAGRFEFVERAFFEVILTEVQLGVFDRRERPTGFRPKHVGIDEFCRIAGVHRKTALGLIRAGELTAYRAPRGRRWRYALPEHDAHDLRRRRQSSVGPRAAAAEVGLPVSVLHALRRLRLFDFDPSPTLRRGFTRRDVSSLRGQLNRRSRRGHPRLPPEDLITLAQALRRKPQAPERRAQLVGALIRGEVAGWSVPGQGPANPLITLETADLFLPAGQPPPNDCCLPRRAAKAIGTTEMGVLTLVDWGLLERSVVDGNECIANRSLTSFARRYVPAWWVAEELDEQVVARRKRGEHVAVHYLSVPARRRGNDDVFVGTHTLRQLDIWP